MTLIYFVTALFALLFVLIYHASVKPALLGPPEKKTSKAFLWCLLGIAFLVRIIVAVNVVGHNTDMNTFRIWSGMAYRDGLPNFYMTDALTDYPPGYIYVLWLIGGLQSWLSLDYNSTLFVVLVKLPALLCDIAIGYLAYEMIRRKVSHAAGIAVSALFVFNPAIVVNSAAWGQMDSVQALLIILFIWALLERKMLMSCICFVLGCLVKQQMAVFTPVLLFGVWNMVFGWKDEGLDEEERRQRRSRGLKDLAISAGVCIVLVFVLVLPFARDFDFATVIDKYFATLGLYPYASVNAFNLFALFGGNWKPIDQQFFIFTYRTWTSIFIVADVALAVWVFIRHKHRTNLYLVGALLITTLFVMAGMMHERYVYPALALLLCAFAYKKDTRCLWLFGALSITQFLNTAVMFYQNVEMNTTAAPDGALVPLVAVCNLCILGYMIYVAFTGDRQPKWLLTSGKSKKKGSAVKAKKGTAKSAQKSASASATRPGFSLQKSEAALRLVKWDYLIMAAVVVVYAAVALFNLGDMSAPETVWKGEQSGDGFVVEFNQNTYIDKLKVFTGAKEERTGEVSYGVDSGGTVEWSTPAELKFGSVFCWHEESVKKTAKYVQITATKDSTWINEIAFIDSSGQVIAPKSIISVGADRGISNLTDESALVPDKLSYRNSTYFDEIYHARTAYEFTNSMWAYENTHPPLGKVFISLGILLFGMNPFGWRIIGTLFGIAMLPCIYIFAKKMFKRTDVASIAMILFAADFMHFAQTRIATIDVYITFFIIPMYYFMYRYTTMSFYDTPLSKTLIPLGLSGLFMGLGIASKWTGVYAGIGLAVLFFFSLGRRWYEYRKVMEDKRASAALKQQVTVFPKYAVYTLLACVGFFIAVPVCIYAASYIPWLQAPDAQGIKTIWENQNTMFSYHSTLNATHPFSSLWYEWPVIVKPIWYYSGATVDGVRESIASFGNPFIWWMGLAALAGVVIIGIKKRDWKAFVLLVGYFAQYLPWVGVTRIVFIYHYFTCVPFLILMLAYIANFLLEKYPYRSGIAGKVTTCGIWIYVAACVALFIAFYPVLSGAPASADYINGLKWFDSWIF